MKALIDADIIAYSCSCITDGKQYRLDAPFGTVTSSKKKELNEICDEYNMPHDVIETFWEPEDVANTCHSMKLMLMRILEDLDINLDDCQLYLSDDNNFRYQVDPDYKANRKSMRVPKNLVDAKEYLKNNWDTKILPNHEADDVLGIIQWKDYVQNYKDPTKCQTIICTLDKDLNMIPGWHFNWRTGDTFWVEEFDAMRLFYEQLLKGDRVDNIIGLKNIGDVRATKMIEIYSTEKEMWDKAVSAYVTEEGDPTKGEERALRNARLLWIRREPNQMWTPPK